MKTQSLSIELSYGLQTFHHVIAVSEDFDFRSLAALNGLELKRFEPKNEQKFGGMGFVVYRSPDRTYYGEVKELTIAFLNGKPLFASFRGNIIFTAVKKGNPVGYPF